MAASMNRMERMGRMISAQAMQPLSYLIAFHTQQLMSEEIYVKVIGDWAQRLSVEAGTQKLVNPLDLLVEFDVNVRDGSLPTDSSGSLAEFWNMAFQTITKSPELMQNLDSTRIFLHMARLAGAKDVQTFMRSPQAQGGARVAPDAQVQQQAQAGNLVPIDQAASMAPPMGQGPVQ
jgi:hypothetical protein